MSLWICVACKRLQGHSQTMHCYSCGGRLEFATVTETPPAAALVGPPKNELTAAYQYASDACLNPDTNVGAAAVRGFRAGARWAALVERAERLENEDENIGTDRTVGEESARARRPGSVEVHRRQDGTDSRRDVGAGQAEADSPVTPAVADRATAPAPLADLLDDIRAEIRRIDQLHDDDREPFTIPSALVSQWLFRIAEAALRAVPSGREQEKPS